MNKTSILADTLAGIEAIREGIEKNANHILKSTLKEDLEDIVRKGLNEFEDEEETPIGQTSDMAGDIPAGLEGGDGGSEMTDGGATAGVGEPSGEPIPAEFGAEDGEDPLDLSTNADGLPGDPEVIDLTDKTDDEVIQHFSLMSPADEIEVVQTPEGGIQINIAPAASPEAGMGGEEMGANLGGEESADDFGGGESPIEDPEATEAEPTETPGEEDGETDGGEGEDPEADDTTTGDEDDDEKKPVAEGEASEGGEEPVEEDVAHVVSKTHMKHAETSGELATEGLQESLKKTRQKVAGLMTENTKKTKELEEMTALVSQFKAHETEYKKAISTLKGNLQEVALFTSNLSYVVKLVTENSTTKDEKLDIIKRFDKAKTLSESREIYTSLESLLNESKKSTDKIIEEQVLKTPKASGSSTLNESTAYKNPQIERMLDIIGKIK